MRQPENYGNEIIVMSALFTSVLGVFFLLPLSSLQMGTAHWYHYSSCYLHYFRKHPDRSQGPSGYSGSDLRPSKASKLSSVSDINSRVKSLSLNKNEHEVHDSPMETDTLH